MRSLHGLFDVSGMRGVRKWLDVRAPEDRLSAASERGHAAPSPKITRYVEDYFAFDEAGDREGVKETLRRLIDETVAVNKVSGVPIHAHDPLPDEFLARVFPDAGAFKSADRFVADIDPDVRPMVRQQLERLFADRGGDGVLQSGRGARKDATAFVDTGRALSGVVPAPEGEATEGAPDATVGERAYLLNPAASRKLNQGTSFRTLPYDPERDRADAKPVGLPVVVVQAVRTFGPPALAGGALSVVAEWAVNRDKATAWDYTAAFLSGAAAGAFDPKSNKVKFQVALAMGGSIAGDLMNDRSISVPRALGAGLGAYLVAKFGPRFLGAPQGGARLLLRKFGDKYLKAFLKDVLGQEFELSARELRELWEGLESQFEQQLSESPTHAVPAPY